MKFNIAFSTICGCCLGIELYLTKEDLSPIDKFAMVLDLLVFRILIRISK